MIFSGNLRSGGFKQLCGEFLIPFIQRRYPVFHRVHMDNARHHVSQTTVRFFNRNELNHFKTPPQSPDLNPIKLVWHDLKVHLANEVQKKFKKKISFELIYFLN